ncbi:MAG TPA: hypothetical protein VLZ75_07380 [Chitinophagales bacterium]|nr:hypothetical protein [Chitinophagales bacterium]
MLLVVCFGGIMFSVDLKANDTYLKLELSDFDQSYMLVNKFNCSSPVFRIKEIIIGNKLYNIELDNTFGTTKNHMFEQAYLYNAQSFNYNLDRCSISDFKYNSNIELKGDVFFLGGCTTFSLDWKGSINYTNIGETQQVMILTDKLQWPDFKEAIISGAVNFNLKLTMGSIGIDEINNCSDILPKSVKLNQIGSTSVKWWKEEGGGFVEQTALNPNKENVLGVGLYKVTTEMNSCTLEKQFTIAAGGIPQVDLGATVKYKCEGEYITLTSGLATVQQTGLSFVWQKETDGYWSPELLSTGNQLTTVVPGKYKLIVSNLANCSSESIVDIVNRPKPQPTFDQPVVELDWGQNVSLEAKSLGSLDIVRWMNGLEANPIVVDEPGKYSVVVTNQYGCSTPASVKVFLKDDLAPTLVHDGKSGERLLDQLSLNDNAKGIRSSLNVKDITQYRTFDKHQYSAVVSLLYNRTEHTDLNDLEADMVKVKYAIDLGGLNALQNGELYLSLSKEQPVYQALNVHEGMAEISLDVTSVEFLKSGSIVSVSEKFQNDFRLELNNKILFRPKMITNDMITQFDHKLLGDGHLRFHWEHFHSAYEYELEYVFLDKYIAQAPTTTDDFLRLFQQQGVRVSTYDTYYELFPTFPEGHLYYRIRPVGRHIYSDPETYAFGLWSTQKVIDITSTGIAPFEASRNWEKTLTFAEGGKKKEIITYYDKMLRPQQVATHLSTDKLTLFAETFYDYEGRPVVNVLPVPYMDQEGLHFKELLTKSHLNPTEPYSKFDFDFDDNLQGKVSVESGAGNYYWVDNHLLSTYKKADLSLLPNANGAVTTQVRYSLDATGRTVAQSGVGETFALNDPDKRFSRMFYGTTSETELSRMFGSNVGQSVFYKKNMVVDPNGQISISFVDMKGNTIATCLAGETPINLEKLISNEVQTGFTTSLNKNNKVNQAAMQSITQATILNTNIGVYTFNYSLDGIINKANTGAFVEQPVCAACIYDLEISITNPEGKPVELQWSGLLPGEDPLVYRKKIEPQATWECLEDEIYTTPLVEFTANFNDFGNYVVTKKLVLSEGVIEALILEAKTEGVLPELEEFLSEAEERVDVFNPCTCEGRCQIFVEEQMLTYDPNNEEQLTEAEYRTLKLNECQAAYCDAIELTSNDIEKLAESECEGIRNQIKSQLSPGGPFFESVSCQPSTFGLLENLKPKSEEEGLGEDYYRLIYDQLTASNANVQLILTENWDDAIAETFAPLHREYRHYVFCMEEGKELTKFQYEMSMVNTWSEARTKNYVKNGTGKNLHGTPIGASKKDPVTNLVSGFLEEKLKLPVTPSGSGFTEELLWFILDYEDNTVLESSYLLKLRKHLLVKSGVEPTARPEFLLPHYDDPVVLLQLDTLKWEIYKGVYFAKRYEAIVNYKKNVLGITFANDENTIVEDATKLLSMDYALENNDRLARELCEEGCDGNAQMWLSMLAGRCPDLNEVYGSDAPADKAQIAHILSEMKRICKNNCGDGYLNPWGMLSPDDENLRQEQIGQIMDLVEDFGCSDITPDDIEFIFPQFQYEYMGEDSRDDNAFYLLTLFMFSAIKEGQMYVGQKSDIYSSEQQCFYNNTNAILLSKLSVINKIILGLNPNQQGKCPVELNDTEFSLRMFLDATYPDKYSYSMQSERVSNGFDIDINMLSCYDGTDDADYTKEENCPSCEVYMRFWDKDGQEQDVGNKARVMRLENKRKADELGIPFPETDPFLSDKIARENKIYSGYIVVEEFGGASNNGIIAPELVTSISGAKLNSWDFNGQHIDIDTSIISLEDIAYYLNEYDTLGGWYLEYDSIGGIIVKGGLDSINYGQINFSTHDGDSSHTIIFDYDSTIVNKRVEVFSDTIEAMNRLNEVNAQRNTSGLDSIGISGFDKDSAQYAVDDYFDSQTLNMDACDCETKYTMTGSPVKYCYYPDKVGWFPCSSDICSNANPALCSAPSNVSARAAAKTSGLNYHYIITEIPYNCKDVIFPIISKGKFTVGIQCEVEEDYCEQFDLPENGETQPSDPCFICPGAVATEAEWDISCKKEAKQNAKDQARITYQNMVDALKDELYSNLFNQCMNGLDENFSYSGENGQYHYTLYYYDQANNLVQTVPPEGVDLLDLTDFIEGELITGSEPAHRLRTTYQYNSRGQLIRQISPDGGESKFWYNRLGQLRFSQNAKQALNDKYSFTVYDKQGRISFVGEYDNTVLNNTMDDMLLLMSTFPYENNELNQYCSQITETQYDYSRIAGLPSGENLRNRVAASVYYDQPNQSPITANISPRYRAALYDYDEIGNVKNIWQIYKESAVDYIRKFLITYDFDLYSGKVNKVTFKDINRPTGLKKGYLTHRYEYDSDNRITAIYSSKDDYIEQCEARYFYYPHGPLARVELGHDQVQGIDYAYTLQGWLKYINKPGSSPSSPGANPLHEFTGIAEHSVMLGYFKGDYTPILGAPLNEDIWDEAEDYFATDPSPNPQQHARELYNGNIAWMQTAIGQSLDTRFSSSSPLQSASIQTNNGVQVMAYNYDQLNRIKGSQTYGLEAGQLSHRGWYDTKYSYDANGNIKSLSRNALGAGSIKSPVLIDDFVYNYAISNNQLNSVDDQIEAYASLAAEVQDIKQGQDPLNYIYDQIGNLTSDAQEGIDNIIWNVYGKISEIQFKVATDKPNLSFLYDATGNRIAKIVLPKDVSHIADTTWYVRDAQGNVLYTETSLHTYPASSAPETFSSEEYHLYGSSRLGMYQDKYIVNNVSLLNEPGDYYLQLGKKRFELNNHLGNVLATISDFPEGSSGVYFADLLMAQDYYPFGMPMPGRSYEKGQCVEKDVEGSGEKIINNDFDAIASSSDKRGVSDWNNQLFVLNSINQLKLGNLSWYDRSGEESTNGAMKLQIAYLPFTEDDEEEGTSIGVAARELGTYLPGAYRLNMNFFGAEALDVGFVTLVETSKLLAENANVFEDEELEELEAISAHMITNDPYQFLSFSLTDTTELSILIAAAVNGNDSSTSILVDNIFIEKTTALSPSVSTNILVEDFSQNPVAWRVLDLDENTFSHIRPERFLSTGALLIDSLTGLVQVSAVDTIHPEYIVLARDFNVVSGNTYKIGFNIDSLYGFYGLNLKISETQDLSENIWWNNKIAQTSLNGSGYYEFEVKAQSESLSAMFFKEWDSTRVNAPYFSMSNMTITKCNTINPNQNIELFSDSFNTGSLSGFYGYYPELIDVDSSLNRLVLHPNAYVISDSVITAYYSLSKKFAIPEFGRYRLSLHCEQSGISSNPIAIGLEAIRDVNSQWVGGINIESTGNYSFIFDAFTDSLRINLWQTIIGDSTQLIYIKDVVLERIYSSDSCELLTETLEDYKDSWRTSIWSTDFYSPSWLTDISAIPEAEFGELVFDTLNEHLSIHPYWLRDIVSETGSEMANSQVAFMAKDLETTVGKQYRVEFDLTVNDTNSFDFFIAGAWKSYLTGIAEPMDFNGFESVVPLEGSGTYRLDFTATTDQYVFEILGISDSMGYKPEIAYSIDNFSFNLFDIDSTELLWKIGFDSLPEDIYSYIVEEDDTLSMGIISYDTIENRLRVNLLEDEAPEYVGILMKDVVLEADRYYRFRPTISVISTSNDLTGVMALTRDHSESNIRDMKIFDVNQASEIIFYSESGGLQTLLLGVMGDSSTYYYVDSLSLELLDISISELYSNDFSTSAAGWRSKFADSLELTAGRIDWQSEDETMRIWPWGNDVGVIGSVVREIDVVPGIYNMVMAKVILPDHPNAKVSLGVYDELAANVNFSTLSVEPMAHAEAEDFEETILYFTFRPNTDKMSLVMMYQSAEFGRVILDDVKVISIEPFERDTLLSMTFDDTSGVYDDWRSSIWPDSLISIDSILLSYISHDTLQGRMRLDMVQDFNNENELLGATARKLTGLQVGKKYEASFEIQTDGVHRIRQVNSVVFPNSEFRMGIIQPVDTNMIQVDSVYLDQDTNHIVLRFTATESDMVISISANARRAAPYHYYIDNFQLREGFVKTLNCDRSNLQLADQESRYRFGFNGQERQTELGPSFTTAEYWMYDGRLGRRWNIDPEDYQISEWSPYVCLADNPNLYVDKNGDVWHIIGGGLLGGGIELGSQLISSGFEWDEVDWFDVGIETGKGALIAATGGTSIGLVTTAEVSSTVLKASIDITEEKGLKNVGGGKPLIDAVVEGGLDFAGGKITKKVEVGLDKTLKVKLTNDAVEKQTTKVSKEAVRLEKQVFKDPNLAKQSTQSTQKRLTTAQTNLASSKTAQTNKTIVKETSKSMYETVAGAVEAKISDGYKWIKGKIFGE